MWFWPFKSSPKSQASEVDNVVDDRPHGIIRYTAVFEQVAGRETVIHLPHISLAEDSTAGTSDPEPPHDTEVECLPTETAVDAPMGHTEASGSRQRNPVVDPTPEPNIHTLEEPDVERYELIDTVPLEAVSTRTTRMVRGTDTAIHYFSSLGSERIRNPPQIPRDRGIQAGDLYIHRCSLNQWKAWRCSSIEPCIVWQELPVGTTVNFPNGQTRIFVITETGLPGWVTKETLQRKYKDHWRELGGRN